MTAPLSRSEAQQRADAVHGFQRELARLEAEKVLVLTDQQHGALAAYHDGLLAEYARAFDIDRDAQARQLSLGMRIASFLGALALAASVFFLFYRFWGLFPTAAQVAMLVGAALGSFGALLLIQARDRSGYFTNLAAMVAFTCFVLNVAMLGQIFDITPSDKALLAWAAYALLLAYACDLRLLLVAGILCLDAYVGAHTGTLGGLYWPDLGHRPENFFAAAVLLFAVPALLPHRRLPDFPAVYRVFSLLTFFLPVLVLSQSGYGSYLHFGHSLVEDFYLLVGFAGSAGAVWLGVRRHWGHVVNTGVVLFIVFLFTKFFDWWWDVMPKYLFFLVLALAAVLVLLVLQRLRRHARAEGAGR